jgi:hypothetical protein
MKNPIITFLLILICGCSDHNEHIVYDYAEISDIPIEETQDGFLLIGLFTHQHIDDRGVASILWNKTFSFSIALPESNPPSERGKIQVDLNNNVIRLNTNLVSWWVKPDFDLTDFEFLEAPISKNSLNIVAQKTHPEKGISEVITVNYYLGDRPKLLEIKRKMQ